MEKQRHYLLLISAKVLIFISLYLSLSIPAFGQSPLSAVDADAALKARLLSQSYSFASLPAPTDFDITFHRLILSLDPAEHFITGSVVTYFKSLGGASDRIWFDLSDSLDVHGVRYHGELLEDFTHENNRLTITFPGATPLVSGGRLGGGLDSIQVDYSGAPQSSGMGSFTSSTHGDGVPVLYTLSQPYSARDWWPCRQDLSDKIDSVMLVITTPDGYRAAANGVLLREQLCDDRSTFIWMHRHPIAAYLIGVAVTNYRVFSEYVPVPGHPSIEILNYVYPEEEESVRAHIPQIIKPFQIYNELFGLYPFADEHYGHAQWNWGGGMEHQTMSFMGSFGYDLLVHELAHQWFGDFVTCGSWQDIWLNEGFATYLTGLCYERDLDGAWWEPFKRLTIERVMQEPGGSVFCYDTTSVERVFNSRLSYSKGAIVLHMLRWEMGDEAFFRGLNTYLHDPTLANGFAYTPDLQRHLEAAADTSFTEFFNDWVYGEGYPIYLIGYRSRPDNILEINISQDPSHISVGFFEMHLPLRLIGHDRDTLVVFHHTHQDQLFTINPGFPVQSVEFDPDRQICTANSIITHLDPAPADGGFSVYPNPFNETISISHPLSAGPMTVKIHDINGREVFRKVVIPETAKTIRPNLKSGTYLLTIHHGSETFSFTLIKK